MCAQLSSVGEFELIKHIARSANKECSVIKGIGDDTAVLPLSKGEHLLFTTDMLAEGIHFTKRMPAERIGRKALACSISDIAAMGGIPTYAVISFGAPAKTSVAFAKSVFKGINKLAKQFQVSIVGGDTIKSDKIIINVALLGVVKKKELVLRSGALKGDVIFATGSFGCSLKRGKHLSFVPRVKESQFLAKKIKPSSMIDISDGLVADLSHVLKESKVGAVLYEDRIPKAKKATLQNALHDGEDFELVFTLSRSKARQLNKMRIKSCRFYEIGEIVDKKRGFSLINFKGVKEKINIKGYEHF